MTDNTNQSNPVTPDAMSDLPSSTTTWQLTALTAALGDLQLSVSDSLSVGRGSDNDVVLGSKAVSRNHAVLSVLDTELYVKDLDSSNGTFVNNKRIEANKTVQLNADDKLGFASFEFQVMALAAEDIESSAIDPATKEPKAKEPEEIVGSVQEDLESTSTPSKQSATESSLPPAAVEETIAARPASPSETVSVEATPEPVVKETIVEEVLAASAGEAAMSAAPVEEDIIAPTPAQNEPQETVAAEPVAKEQVAATPVFEDPVVKEPATKDPVVEEPIVKEPKAEAPVAERQSPEYDKTTTTSLQEEADPEVLRAKQAATAQFSGTANLGQSRDLGTTGNNAMDQAVNNPANTAASEKKASGGWFIWVFIALIIIGIALWLFNMGGA
ncbi:FHA domain-containing protein [uncultured Psychrobacter sp.]|uniref:FHA domain-containing protein n=1 Tax=uncultured Psychrobacter sp. TaxID=259303 RepID=UPI002618505A|nr:FHA domain-containing protein [uncultured Psychrobacter sp.]